MTLLSLGHGALLASLLALLAHCGGSSHPRDEHAFDGGLDAGDSTQLSKRAPVMLAGTLRPTPPEAGLDAG